MSFSFKIKATLYENSPQANEFSYTKIAFGKGPLEQRKFLLKLTKELHEQGKALADAQVYFELNTQNRFFGIPTSSCNEITILSLSKLPPFLKERFGIVVASDDGNAQNADG